MPFLPTEVRLIITRTFDFAGDAVPAQPVSITCDASISEDHVFKNTITKIPIEDGSIVTDHITLEPTRLETVLLFTDTPVSNFDPLEQFNSAEGRGRKIFQQLLKFRNDKAILTVTTGLQGYTNMAIEELSAPRRSGDGKKVQTRCVFSEIPVIERSGSRGDGITKSVIFDVSHTVRGLINIGSIP